MGHHICLYWSGECDWYLVTKLDVGEGWRDIDAEIEEESVFGISETGRLVLTFSEEKSTCDSKNCISLKVRYIE